MVVNLIIIDIWARYRLFGPLDISALKYHYAPNILKEVIELGGGFSTIEQNQ
ncbi:hypothetical protein SAMN02745724_03409 [Pseudoalteromonas denitrificans DSM 6059]|jgi:hypothetical protein|uniref:Uncharacterized protein n=1 Tax=Pseudoalteromonas denitrificans DSM 6059 TaxID=1123010 RepID=A0A1I1PPR2_9GAMM|nr:hypothetical protein SAMN02745724_03409 [Pseudoalteromonas denitrificans DSM 6059]